MTMRKRSRSKSPNVSGGGGGGPSTGAITIGPDFGDGQPTVTMSVGTVSLSATTTDMNDNKDVYWPDITLCPDDTNKDGTQIQVEGVIATKKVGCMGFDVSAFPTGTTVSSGTLKLVVQTPPAAVDATDRLRLITTGTETWAETTAICSSHPADDGSAASDFTVTNVIGGGAAGDVKTITLAAGALTRLANRMGASTFSLIADSTTITTTNHAFYDLENGSVTQRPRLTFAWNKTL